MQCYNFYEEINEKYIVLAAFVILAVSSIGYLYINYKVGGSKYTE